MNITGFQTAVNHAVNTSGKLTQYSPGAAKPASEGSASRNVEAKLITNDILAFWDDPYTKQDAVLREWRKGNRITLDDLYAGKVLTPSRCWNPSAETLAAFEKELQSAGPSTEMDWRNLAQDFNRTDFDDSVSTSQIGEDEFTSKLDYITSRYAAAEQKITKNYTGSARQEQMDKLNGMYGETLNRLAESYANLIGKVLEENGVGGEQEKIRASVVSGAEQKVAAYRENLGSLPGLASLEGTDDAWLLGDDEYIAAVLRGTDTGRSSSAAKVSDAPYTVRDLDVLGQYASALSKSKLSIDTMDEEHIGLEFAMLDMKTDTLRKSGAVSSAMGDTLQKLVDGYMNAAMERMDEALSGYRAKNMIAADCRGFAALDRESVWNVHDYTMQQYRQTGDVIKALLAGADFGRQQRGQKAAAGLTDGIYRYKNSVAYWENFEKAGAAAKTGYQTSTPPFSQYLAGWNDFNASLSDAHIRLNLTLNGLKYGNGVDAHGHTVIALA